MNVMIKATFLLSVPPVIISGKEFKSSNTEKEQERDSSDLENSENSENLECSTNQEGKLVVI